MRVQINSPQFTSSLIPERFFWIHFNYVSSNVTSAFSQLEASHIRSRFPLLLNESNSSSLKVLSLSLMKSPGLASRHRTHRATPGLVLRKGFHTWGLMLCSHSPWIWVCEIQQINRACPGGLETQFGSGSASSLYSALSPAWSPSPHPHPCPTTVVTFLHTPSRVLHAGTGWVRARVRVQEELMAVPSPPQASRTGTGLSGNSAGSSLFPTHPFSCPPGAEEGEIPDSPSSTARARPSAQQ